MTIKIYNMGLYKKNQRNNCKKEAIALLVSIKKWTNIKLVIKQESTFLGIKKNTADELFTLLPTLRQKIEKNVAKKKHTKNLQIK